MTVSMSPTAAVAHDADLAVLSTGDVRLPVHAEAPASVPRRADQPYRPVTGETGLRELVAAHASPDRGARLRPDRVIITPGARQAILLALYALPAGRREVLLSTPYWASYPHLIRLAGGVPVPVLGVVGGMPDRSVLESLRSPATGCVVVNSPRNPDGAVASRAWVREVTTWAAEHGIQVLFDQIYRGVPLNAEPAPTVAQLDDELPAHCVLVDGVTKSHALAGLRLGWAVAGEHHHATMAALASHLLGGVCLPAQEVAAEVLRRHEVPVRVGAALRANLDLATGALAGLPGVTCPEPDGGIFLFPDLRGWLSGTAPPAARADLTGWLRDEHRVAVVDGAAFGAPGHVRLSFAVPGDLLARGVSRLRAALGGR